MVQLPPSWKFNPEQISTVVDEYICKSKRLDDEISSTNAPSVENVLLKYASHHQSYQGLLNQITFLQHVSPDKELRDASTAAEQKLQEFSIESGLRADVYDKFKALTVPNDEDFETKRYLKKINTEFKRNGLDLSKEQQAEVEQIQKRLAKLSSEFNKNLGEQTEFILFTAEELEGVPADVINQFEKVEDNKLKVTFKYPDILPVLKYANSEKTRKLAYIANQNKLPQNESLLIETIKLRTNLAQIMKYKNFADYILEIKMAKNSETVLEFLDNLETKLTKLGKIDLNGLKELKLKETGESNFYVWDYSYYNNKFLELNFNINHQLISEYFEINHTIDNMFKIFENLFSIKFEEQKEFDSWHKDVKLFKITSVKNNGDLVGYLYLDLHPRDGKYGHAANFGLYPGYLKEDGARNYPVTALVCNFSKPTESKPSLLKHEEVTTLFHELGHGIHDLLSKVKYASLHGPSGVSWDFVEAPSQMLEYWTWDLNELKFLSKHYKTGETIPDELANSLIRTKHVNSGLFYLRQLYFAKFDMNLHILKTSDLESFDILELSNKIKEITLLSSDGVDLKQFNSFGHIMGGYQAGYYGYLWSQVFAADMFYTLFAKDLRNVENGTLYSEVILGRGGSVDELENLKLVLKREPNNMAFSQELGISD